MPTERRSRYLLIVLLIALVAVVAFDQAEARHGELPNRIPEPAPYNVDEAQFYPPPWEGEWTGVNDPGSCDSCHSRIFGEWNGSMMSNSWRDPAWRGAFLLVARLTATDGNCDLPDPPDGTTKALINPFANGDCTSTFDLGDGTNYTFSGSGSLLDGFCSRCHMPANYIDNVPLANVGPDSPSGLEHGLINPTFDPTSDDGTGLAFATVAGQFRNTEPGKWGIFCETCHNIAETRETPFHNYPRNGVEYVPALGTNSRDQLVPMADQDQMTVPDPSLTNQGYGVGAGAYRLSPHAISQPERFGPLSWNDYTGTIDNYVSEVFDLSFPYALGDFSGKHDGFRHVLFERAEMCATCHDVTNPLTIKNQLGNWVGGFPIERTYTEWANSRYADRPGNSNYDPAFKRDCQTCHMQQNYGAPGTAQVLYQNGLPIDPVTGQACSNGPLREPFYTHHFIGGNAYVTRLIGRNLDAQGNSQPYPELSTYSYSSADETSIYHNAYWENVPVGSGSPTQHAQMAWDRLRNVLTLDLSGPASASAGTSQPLSVSVTNSGSGHNFPSGFPEGRNAWLSVRAWDLASGDELEISDSFWSRTSLGVGYLTDATVVDPAFPGCNWALPAGSPDPYSYQFKAVASLGDGCPTLDLPYATPLNLVTNAQGLPVDSGGQVIGRANPLGLPQFTDIDGDGDLYDDAFLTDTRLRPLPNADATVALSRYSVVIPPGTLGPVAVTAAVYYQSMEAVVGKKFLGNLADTDLDFDLEPCVLKGLCDGRTPAAEPAVVEGSPPVPMEVASWVIGITGQTDGAPPSVLSTYPADGATDVYENVVIKIHFSEPVTGVDATSFTLDDGNGPVPAFVDQVSDGVWALFPHQVLLDQRGTYTATLTGAGVCDTAGNCLGSDVSWTFDITRNDGGGVGDTTIALGFGVGGGGDPVPTVTAISPADGTNNVLRNTNVVATFSEPVMNVTSSTFLVNEAGGNGKSCNTLGAAVSGTLSANVDASQWTFDPSLTLGQRVLYCVTLTTGIQDLAGQPLAAPFTSSFKTGNN